jgi:predicted nucleotidyltransferase
MLDLTDRELDEVRRILAQYLPSRTVFAFGSRAAGTSRRTSDLDLAVEGAEPLSLDERVLIREAFEESWLSFRVDVIEWSRCSEEFKRLAGAAREPVQAPVTELS